MSKSFKKDLTGQRFGRLTVLEFVPDERPNSSWLCKCDCGKTKIVNSKHFYNSNTQSCGCLKCKYVKRRTKHNLTKTRIYRTWDSMLQRCYNSHCVSYQDYGKRGISVCDEWKESLEAFYKWSLEHGYNDTLTIDRIDVNGNYEPSNCRWIDKKVQVRNRRITVKVEYDGTIISLGEAAEKSQLPYGILWTRYKKGDRGEKLFRPVKRRN